MAAGNYVNLIIGERVYPLRATMSKLSANLEAQGFCRIYRSYAVKLDDIASITSLQSGDREVVLTSGKKLKLLWRYKEQFKGLLQIREVTLKQFGLNRGFATVSLSVVS